MRRWIPICTSVLALCAGLQAEPRFPGGYLNDAQPGRVTTPHIEWARPWAPGTIKVFFLSPGYVAPRELIELWQRLDITYEAVVGITSYDYYDLNRTASDQWGRSVIGCNPAEKMDELREKLSREYDVYCFAQFDWESAPEWVRAFVLQKVSDEGKGLVLTWQSRNNGMGKGPGAIGYPMTDDPDGVAYMTQGTPFHGLPYFATPALGTNYYEAATRAAFGEKEGAPANTTNRVAQCIKCYRYGKGRVAWVGWHGSIQGYWGQPALTPTLGLDGTSEDIYYDYYLFPAARAVTWAAPGKVMPLRLKANPIADGVTCSLAEAAKLQATLKADMPATSLSPATLKVQWTVRDTHGNPEQADIQKWGDWSKEAPLAWSLKPLGAGKHFVDWIIRDRDSVVNWGSVSVFVDSGVKITAVTLTKPTFEPRQPVSGDVQFSAPCPSGSRLEVSLVDTYGRRFSTQSVAVKAAATRAPFLIHTRDAVALAARVQVDLVGPAGKLADGETLVYLPSRTWPRYIFSLWGGDWPGVLGRRLRDELRRGGFNLLGLEEPKIAALSDEPAMPTNIASVPGNPIDKTPFSFADPEWRRKSVAELSERIKQWAPYSFIGYSYGDEMSFGGMGKDPAVLKLFAQRLQQKYGTLDKLNAAWNETNASWEEAAKPIGHGEAIQHKSYAHFEDWVSHEEFLYADVQHEYSRTIHAIQPDALTGAEGSENGDLEFTVSQMEFWGPYYGRFQNALLSAIRRERKMPLVWGNWWGSYTYYWGTDYFRTPVTSPYLLWNFTLDGANTVEFFTADGTEGIRHIDGGFGEHFMWSAPDVWKLGNGVGQLIADAAPGARGLYVVHAQPSEHASRLWHAMGGYDSDHNNLLTLLDECGIDAPYLTERQIEAGLLAKKAEAKALFLPDVQALGDAALTTIEQFVANGGTVIADVRPILCDSSLRPRTDGRAEKLFGISRADGLAAPSAVADVAISAAPPQGRPLALTLAKATVDPAVKVTTGAALGKAGDTPVVIVNTVGKGRAILLNFSLSNYGTLRGMQKGDENGMKEFMLALLDGCGVRPLARVERPDGQILELCRSASFTRQGLIILGLLRRPEALEGTGQATLKLAEESYVYDLLGGKFVGRQDRVPITLAPGRRALFALSPYRIEGIDVVAPGKADSGEAVDVKAQMKVADGKPGTHVFRLEVVGPDGREREALRHLAEAPGGKAAFRVPFAFNDAPGKWRIRVVDVASGMQGDADVKLAGAATESTLASAIAMTSEPPQVSKEAAAFPEKRDWSQEKVSLFRFRAVLPTQKPEITVNGRSIRTCDWVRMHGLGLQYWGFLQFAEGSEPQYTNDFRKWDDVPFQSPHPPLAPGEGQFDTWAITCWCRNITIPGGDFNAVWGEGASMGGRGFMWKYYVPGLDAKGVRAGFESNEVVWGSSYQGASLLRRVPDGLAEFRWDFARQDDPAAPKGVLSMRFAKGPDDTLAFARVQPVLKAGSPAPTESVKLTLTLSAVSPTGPVSRERWLRTLGRDERAPASPLTLDLTKDWALAFYNRGAEESGGNMLVFAPEDVSRVTATLRNDLLVLEFTPKAALGAIRVGFWEFEDTPYGVALGKFFGDAGAIRQRLQAVNWRVDQKGVFDVPAYRERLDKMLVASVTNAPSLRQRLDSVTADLNGVAPLLASEPDNNSPNLDAESRFLKLVGAAEDLEQEVTTAWLSSLKK